MQISIVIPVLNEATRIRDVIRLTRSLGDCEIIVVDGGSQDGTPELAGAADMVCASKPGRAAQQNLGASRSRGEVLLFLHSDCQLPADAINAVVKALENPRVVGGCFYQRIDAAGFGYRLLEWGNSQRVRWWKMAYGDQAIFVRKSVFDELGGFPDLRFMEDVYFMKRLRRRGQIALLNQAILVSPRRWQRRGIVRQTIRNWVLLSMAACGIHPDRLAKFYPNDR